ncbi:hypothetical protein [Blattabacterium cuenoti]|uniref:hypothetical protein n=1 Tax=Blattabacterium cuenoti TaxID=1653831 RepID=UPI00163C8E1F|nr:hypothetical protein [Blattabacterium cuenoti]
MIKKIFLIIIFCSFIYSFSLEKIDGIYAIIGNEILLNSEKESYLNDNHSNTKTFFNSKLNDLLNNKLILYYAKQDKILKKYYNTLFLKVKKNNKNKLNPDILQFYENKIKSDYIVNVFFEKKIHNISVTPKEVKYVSNNIEKFLHFLPKKICISYINFNIKNIVNNNILMILKTIKKNIIKKHKFHNYSFLNLKVININQEHSLPKKFINVIHHLDKHKISNIFTYNSNFYFLKKEKRKIKIFSILVNKYLLFKITNISNFDKKEFNQQKQYLKQFIDNIHIETNIWVNESDLIEKIKNKLDFLKIGKISHLDDYTINGKKTFFFVKKIDIFPGLSYSFDKDYEQLKAFTIYLKQKIKMYNWILNHYQKTYIKINE